MKQKTSLYEVPDRTLGFALNPSQTSMIISTLENSVFLDLRTKTSHTLKVLF